MPRALSTVGSGALPAEPSERDRGQIDPSELRWRNTLVISGAVAAIGAFASRHWWKGIDRAQTGWAPRRYPARLGEAKPHETTPKGADHA